VGPAATSEPLIDVDDVTRRYGPVLALDHLSLAVRSGEVHAVLGRNGAGKTTLLRILGGLVRATSGSVRLAGAEVERDVRASSGLVGLVPSGDRSFYLRLSAPENLLFFGRLHGLRKAEARERAAMVLERVGLPDVGTRPMSTFSHGMQKRVSVARALLTDPQVLLVDEATHDLDPEGASTVRSLVRRAVDRGAAALWATQRVEEVRGLADRVTVLEQGSAVFQGTVSELLARTGARRFVVVLGANGRGLVPTVDHLAVALAGIARIAPLDAADGTHLLVLNEHTNLGEAIGGLLHAGATVLACRQERPEVEDAFLELVGAQGCGS
jgi:ABC-2 type transport system ATP-binding protein